MKTKKVEIQEVSEDQDKRIWCGGYRKCSHLECLRRFEIPDCDDGIIHKVNFGFACDKNGKCEMLLLEKESD